MSHVRKGRGSKGTLRRWSGMFSMLWVFFFAGLWELIASIRPDVQGVMPRLGAVLERFFRMLADGRLLTSVFYSMSAVLIALVLSFALAILFLYVSRRGFLRSGVDTAAALFGSVPGVAILPLVILWFGLSRASLLWILVHAMIWPIWIAMSSAKDRMEERFGEFVVNYRIPYHRFFLQIVLQGSLSDCIAALRVAWSRGWRAVISVEMIFGLTGNGSGLGWLIYERRMYMDTAGMLAALLGLALCGLLFERGILARLGRKRTGQSVSSPREKTAFVIDKKALTDALVSIDCGAEAMAQKEFGPVLLEARGLSKRYEGGEPLFEELSFGIREGELLVLMGRSGVGKSSLLRMLAGIDPYYDGEIILADPDAMIPLVFQESDTLLAWKSVEENLRFVRPTIASSELDTLLAAVGLDAHREKSADQLSGGMKQRLGVARAIATEAKLLLMDEPFAGLDTETRHEMWDWIRKLRRELGLTLVLVTHSEEEASALGDRILRLEGEAL